MCPQSPAGGLCQYLAHFTLHAHSENIAQLGYDVLLSCR